MRTIQTLQQRLAEAPTFAERYPECGTEDGKTHVLFVAPVLDGSGFYRMIAPALELNQTATHTGVISHIHTHDFTKRPGDFDTPIEPDLLRWADVVVFPPLFTPIAETLATFRAVNADLRYVMDVDRDFLHLPADHPMAGRYTADEQNHLVRNLSKMHRITVANEALVPLYREAIKAEIGAVFPAFGVRHNLNSRYGFEHIRSLAQPKPDTVRIGLVGDATWAGEFALVADALSQVKSRYGKRVEVVYFGWHRPWVEGGEPFVEHEQKRSVSITRYHGKLNHLALDMALIPLRDTKYNRASRSWVRWLELSGIHVPTIASDVGQLGQCIEDGRTGLLVRDHDRWLGAIESMIAEPMARYHMAATAYSEAWSRYCYHDLTRAQLANHYTFD